MKRLCLWVTLFVCLLIVIICVGTVNFSDTCVFGRPHPEFVPSEHGFTLKIPHYCDFSHVLITDVKSRQVLWHVRKRLPSSSPKFDHFNYGVAPADMRETIPPPPLKGGEGVVVMIWYGYVELFALDAGVVGSFDGEFEVTGANDFRLVQQPAATGAGPKGSELQRYLGPSPDTPAQPEAPSKVGK